MGNYKLAANEDVEHSNLKDSLSDTEKGNNALQDSEPELRTLGDPPPSAGSKGGLTSPASCT
ncbi:hypothetical protein PAXRUDRAFT_20186 [Paxillus rubicundulus Ve08.2h10]|uniref:Uncharacterized protein n=1 Tax=Paxillus rubicundulus Ve08.2h10 TaxID=930991 RepID=A0A0D0CT01_9AGAM|nr:hypothetical protein PAXRUDRAFT_20186 [Paxillus rubicundulus Ve08.2h10]